jgi:hypothetical protein
LVAADERVRQMMAPGGDGATGTAADAGEAHAVQGTSGAGNGASADGGKAKPKRRTSLTKPGGMTQLKQRSRMESRSEAGPKSSLAVQTAHNTQTTHTT